MKSVELFAGAGGLAMGIGLAGFEPLVVAEWDKWACDTLRENGRLGYPLVRNWSVHEGDVRNFDWKSIDSNVDLVAGGPPCQPFSMGGKHRAYDDSRDMFPATVDIVRQLRPRAFIVENVKGLTRTAFANYYQYILLQLEFPEVSLREKEDWYEHLLRLQKEKTSGRLHSTGLTYNIVPTLVNAADYGVPQKRERVFIVGYRSDLDIQWSFPQKTHSFDSLLASQWLDGSYWERHKISRKKRPAVPEKLASRLKRISQGDDGLLPWRTTRDALIGLPDPESRAAKNFLNHRFQGGAKAYPGHTGSALDLPAKTLKAGDHGVPGGENMMVKDDGSVRYFSVREAARIQTFPDGFKFHGAWTETMRQLGNAVPVMLARVVAASVAEKLIISDMKSLAASRKSVRGVA
jgi:DNA (cytosine-5)-methyltransferase 1